MVPMARSQSALLPRTTERVLSLVSMLPVTTSRTWLAGSPHLLTTKELCLDYKGFECPLCGHRRYHRISILREKRPPYRTEFYGCFGCSAMFTDAYQFTQS